MAAYYNEIDPFCVEWLKNLIAAKLIATGDVDSRSITEVTADDVKGYTQCHFFAGIAGWSYALRLAGVSDDQQVWTGSCPCFPAGTLVLCKVGYKPIETVAVGDEVLTHRSRWRRVTHVGSDVSDCVTVKGQGHFGLECTPNHPILTEDESWSRADEMTGKRWATVASVPEAAIPALSAGPVGYSYDRSINAFRVKGEKGGRAIYLGIFRNEVDAVTARAKAIADGVIGVRGANGSDPITLGFARFLGYWLGDGWVSGDNVIICGTRIHRNLLADIMAGAKLSYSFSDERTVVRARCGSKSLSRWLTEHFGAGAGEKRIPAWLHGTSADYREAFLAGYAEADGHVETSRSGYSVQRFTTVSRAIAVGVRILANQAGRSASITLHTPRRGANTIEGRVVSERPFFRVTVYPSARSFRFANGHGWGFVRSVKPSGQRRVYNLAVDDDESYTADGVVVHNCQPFSNAGKRKGFEDERHLWPEFARLLGDCRPPIVFGEQVASKVGREWLSVVRSDLEAVGYAVGAADLCAASVGAPHIRQRLWWVAHAECDRWEQRGLHARSCTRSNTQAADYDCNDGPSLGLVNTTCEQVGLPGRAWEQGSAVSELGDAGRERRQQVCANARRGGEGSGAEGLAERSLHECNGDHWSDLEWLPCIDGKWRPVKPGLFPLAHGVPGRVGKLRAAGNAIVSPLAAEFIAAAMEYTP